MGHQEPGQTTAAPGSFGEHIEDDSLSADGEAEFSILEATRMREHTTELEPRTRDDFIGTTGARREPAHVLRHGNGRLEVHYRRVDQLLVYTRRKLAHVAKHLRAMLGDCRDI